MQSLFSSQLVQVSDLGRISVIVDSWWFAVAAIPLTILTFAVWKYWLFRTIRRQKQNDEERMQAQPSEAYEMSSCRTNSQISSSIGWKAG